MAFMMKTTRSEGDYENPSEGRNVMGLVKVEECTKKEWEGEAELPAYKFSFRCKDNPSAWVNLTPYAKWGNEKCGLYRLLRKMTENRAKLSWEDKQIGEAVDEVLNQWFDVMIVHKPSKKDPSIMRAYIDDYDVRPCRPGDCPSVVATEYFKTAKAAKKTVTETDDDIPF
jgi:hypothetical protein